VKNLKVVLRALGFDPTNDEIIKLIRDLGKGD
jgi:Ca2+-binding EF-hand superfamily protein